MMTQSLPERAAELLRNLFAGSIAEAGITHQLEQLTADELQDIWRAADRLATLAARAKRKLTQS